MYGEFKIDGATKAIWKMDVAAAPITDEVGTHTSTSSNWITYQSTGRFNYAINFPGDVNPGYAMFPDHADFEFGSAAFTVEMWLYPHAFSELKILISKWETSSSEKSWVLEINTAGKALFYVSTDGSNNTGSTSAKGFTANKWHYLAFTRVGDNICVYLNGEEIISHTTTDTLNAGAARIYIGQLQNPTGYNFDGLIDQTRVRKGAGLTAGQVRRYYSSLKQVIMC